MLSDSLLRNSVVQTRGSTSTAVAWRARGRLYVTVIAKATFAFARDAEMTRVDPQGIVREEIHHGNSPRRSVRVTSDLVPFLGQAEVVFTGSAFAPEGTTLKTLPVRLGVFDGSRAVLDKVILVQDPAGFQRIPIVYERAYGGIGFPDNPVGVGANADSGEPSVVDPRAPRRPAGFGPISRTWLPRKSLLRATPRRVIEGAIAELPDDFDGTYFQAAPIDQRAPALGGDAWIVMDGLHETLPRARMRLPGARGAATLHGLAPLGIREGHPLELRADTLRIDGDEQRCTMIWRASFGVPDERALASLRVVAGVVLPGEALVPVEPTAPIAAVRPPSRSEAPPTVLVDLGETGAPRREGTVFLAEEVAPAPAVPFRSGPAPEAVARSSGARVHARDTGTLVGGLVANDARPSMPPRPRASETIVGMPAAEGAPATPTLPFQPVSAAAMPLKTSPPRRRDPSGTLMASPEDIERPALPFSSAAAEDEKPLEAPPPPLPSAPPPPSVAPPPPPSAPPPAEAPAPKVHVARSPLDAEEAPPRRSSARPPRPSSPPAGPPPASPALKRGLYGKYAG